MYRSVSYSCKRTSFSLISNRGRVMTSVKKNPVFVTWIFFKSWQYLYTNYTGTVHFLQVWFYIAVIFQNKWTVHVQVLSNNVLALIYMIMLGYHVTQILYRNIKGMAWEKQSHSLILTFSVIYSSPNYRLFWTENSLLINKLAFQSLVAPEVKKTVFKYSIWLQWKMFCLPLHF